MKILPQAERGQALVLIILTVIGMVGLAALAIDGGMIYAERRRAQNAADAAVYAGALHMARSGYNYSATNASQWNAAYATAVAKAINQAATNGFITGGGTTVIFQSPPTEPSPPQYIGDRSYYQVIIESEVKPVFSQFVFNQPLKYKVWAIARANATMPMANGAAMFATSTNPNYCQALWFTGNGTTHVTGGNIISNNPANSPHGNCYSGVQAGSGSVTVDPPHTIQTVGGFRYDPSSGQVTTGTNPPVQTGIAQMTLPELPAPDCSEATWGTLKTIPNPKPNPFTMTPGRWGNVHWTNGTLLIEPGVYCLTDGLDLQGGEVRTLGSAGQGAFFVVLNGDFSASGNAVINLRRPSNLVLDGFQWGGYLLYMPPENDGLITLAGGGTSTYTGTVYAPGPPAQNNQSKCIVGGNQGNVGLHSQLICYSIKVAGTGSVDITYDPDANGQVPPVVELMN